MATMAKKIYIKNSAGTQQTAELYSTTGEAGSAYAHLVVDNTSCYAALVAPTDSVATNGRVTESNGTTFAIASSGVPEYGYSTFTSGSGSFTVPSRVTKLRVTCVGGGAGSALIDTTSGYWYSGTPVSTSGLGATVSGNTCQLNGLNGGTTTFGSVTAKGAVGSIHNVVTLATDGTENPSFTKCVGSCITVSQGYTNGSYSTNTTGTVYGYATPLVNISGTTVLEAGKGGNCDGGSKGEHVLSGGSGYRTIQTISVTPGQVISYSVGGGGKAVRFAQVTSSDGYGGSGAHVYVGRAGAILVEYGKGVQ